MVRPRAESRTHWLLSGLTLKLPHGAPPHSTTERCG